jgi:ribosome-binding ATPase YchF (GTP1/OBG family)
MSEENNVVNEEVVVEAPVEDTAAEEVETTEAPKDDIESIVEERLAKMKANMDRMASERDEALKMKAEMEATAKEATIARMKEEGKLQEALEMELAEAKAKLEVFAKETTQLKRDGVLNDALAGMEFRNDKSRDMARREIVDQLVQNEEGAWLHSTGSNIRDYVEAYAKSEDNSFLFRVKSNTGAGTGNPAGAPSTDTTKAIGDLSTQEILALAAKGKLGNFNL